MQILKEDPNQLGLRGNTMVLEAKCGRVSQVHLYTRKRFTEKWEIFENVDFTSRTNGVWETGTFIYDDEYEMCITLHAKFVYIKAEWQLRDQISFSKRLPRDNSNI